MEHSAYIIPNSGKDIRPILLDATVPEMTVRDDDGNIFDINGAIRKTPTILLFFLGGW